MTSLPQLIRTPPLGGLVIIYDNKWTPDHVRSKYTRSTVCHAERLVLVLHNTDHTSIPSIAIMLAYLHPPCSTLRSFKPFITQMFADIAMLQASRSSKALYSQTLRLTAKEDLTTSNSTVSLTNQPNPNKTSKRSTTTQTRHVP